MGFGGVEFNVDSPQEGQCHQKDQVGVMFAGQMASVILFVMMVLIEKIENRFELRK